MAGRLHFSAGRRLPISRAALAALAAAALASAAPAVAEGEWIVTTTPAPAQDAGPVWQVGSEGQPAWVVEAVESATPQDVSPQNILDTFVVSSLTGPVPPVPPAAVDLGLPAGTPTPQVTLPDDAPEVVALAAAEAELERINAELADVRGSLEGEDDGTLDIPALQAAQTRLEADKAQAAARVEELTGPVEELRERLEAEAAQVAASTPSPFSVSPGLTFAPVSATVPVIDANLSARLDAYLASKGSPLAGLGAVFVYQSTAVGLDPRMLVAIAGAETSFATYGPSQRIHNPFGMGPGIVYPTWEDGIAGAARNLGGRLYKGSGLVTIAQIQRRWAPLGAGNDPTNLNSHWYRNVSRYYSELGGDPNGSVFTDRSAASTAIPVAPAVAPGIQGTVAAPAAYGAAATVPGGGTNKGPAAVQLAVSFVGTPYVAGGDDPRSGFDYAGLVQYAYAKQGVTLPRTAEQQARVGTPLQPEQLAAGDAVFFADRAGRIHHEGLYIGKGYFVHALPERGGQVMVSALAEPFYASQYAGARRY